MSLWICEVVVCLAMIALSCVFFAATGGFPASINPVDIGPAAFPRLMIVLLCLFAAGQILLSVKNRKRSDARVEIGEGRTLLLGAAALTAYLLLLPVFGYFIVTPVFVILVMLLQGNRRWLQMALVSAGFCLFVYLVFVRFLRVMLP